MKSKFRYNFPPTHRENFKVSMLLFFFLVDNYNTISTHDKYSVMISLRLCLFWLQITSGNAFS